MGEERCDVEIEFYETVISRRIHPFVSIFVTYYVSLLLQLVDELYWRPAKLSSGPQRNLDRPHLDG